MIFGKITLIELDTYIAGEIGGTIQSSCEKVSSATLNLRQLHYLLFIIIRVVSRMRNTASSQMLFPYSEVTIIGCIMLPSAISLSGAFPYVGFMVMDLVSALLKILFMLYQYSSFLKIFIR